MQKYIPKSPLAMLADKLLRSLLAASIGVLWFTFLWGFSLPSIFAGLALGGMLWLCARRFGKTITEKRETQMRRMIGGELAIRRLLLKPPHHAGFQAALWLTTEEPFQMEQIVDWGVLGVCGKERILVRIIVQHERQTVTVQQIVDVAREVQMHQVHRCVLCLTAPASRDAAQFAASCTPPVRMISRSELVMLAGRHEPATDEELRTIGREKRRRRTAQEWMDTALDPSRARKYFWYGTWLGLLAALTRKWTYLLPSLVCMALFAAVKWRLPRKKR